MGNTVVKPNARKIRRLGDDIVVGFAGATADALTLLERLERKLDEYPGTCPASGAGRRGGALLTRSAAAHARIFRRPAAARLRGAGQGVADREIPSQTGGGLRPGRGGTGGPDAQLVRWDLPLEQATIIVSDKTVSLQLTGNGDVLEPADDVIGARPARAARKAVADAVAAPTCALTATRRAAIGSGGPYALGVWTPPCLAARRAAHRLAPRPCSGGAGADDG